MTLALPQGKQVHRKPHRSFIGEHRLFPCQRAHLTIVAARVDTRSAFNRVHMSEQNTIFILEWQQEAEERRAQEERSSRIVRSLLDVLHTEYSRHAWLANKEMS